MNNPWETRKRMAVMTRLFFTILAPSLLTVDKSLQCQLELFPFLFFSLLCRTQEGIALNPSENLFYLLPFFFFRIWASMEKLQWKSQIYAEKNFQWKTIIEFQSDFFSLSYFVFSIPQSSRTYSYICVKNTGNNEIKRKCWLKCKMLNFANRKECKEISKVSKLPHREMQNEKRNFFHLRLLL